MKTFNVVLQVTARNLSHEEALREGFTADDLDGYDPDTEPMDYDELGRAVAGAFYPDMIREALAGSDLITTIDDVAFLAVEKPRN